MYGTGESPEAYAPLGTADTKETKAQAKMEGGDDGPITITTYVADGAKLLAAGAAAVAAGAVVVVVAAMP